MALKSSLWCRQCCSKIKSDCIFEILAKLLNKSGLSFAPTIMVKKLDSQKQSNTVKTSRF